MADFPGTAVENRSLAGLPRQRPRAFPPSEMANEGSASTGRPGAHHIGALAQAAFVEENDGAPLLAGFFF